MQPVAKLSLLAIPILGIMTGNAAISLDMYLPAFPAIAEDFVVSQDRVQVTMSIFLAGFAIGQAVYGPLSDRFGRRPVIIISLLIYGVISAMCAMSMHMDAFIEWRALQGLAGAAGSVLGRAVIRDVYEGPRLAKAMSMLMLMLTAGPMMAPFLGSIVLELYDWRAIFWTLASYAMVWSLLIVLTIPETLPKARRISIHPLAVAAVFKSVLSHRRAMGYALTSALGFAGMFAYITATPFLYMHNFGISPQAYAMFFAVNIGGMAASSFINGLLMGRYNIDQLLGAFLTILVIAAFSLLVMSHLKIGGIWGVAIPLFFYVGSLSAIAANGISGTLQFFGNAAGSASSIFGILQFGLGSIAGWAVAMLNYGTILPMAYIIAVCALTAWITFQQFAKARA